MDIINSNEDILFTILCNISSYKRSKVCTACSLWNTTIGRVISLIENSPSLLDMIKRQHYHSVIRLLKKSNTRKRHKMFESNRQIIGQHMWTVNTPMFAKLWVSTNSGTIWWCDWVVLQVVKLGYDKLFRWMYDSSDLNLISSGIPAKTYKKASLHLAIVLKNPDLITEKNVPKWISSVGKDLLAVIDACCLDKILSLVRSTVLDVICQYVSLGWEHNKHLTHLLMDKVLREFPEAVKYNSYQDILDQYYPDIIVYEGNIDDFYEHEYFNGDNKGCIIPELIEACHNGNISNKQCMAVSKAYCVSGADIVPFYCGIMASNYNKNVVDILNRNRFDSCRLLELAHKYRHRKMARVIVEYIRSRCH